jgi:hypothetical protein
MFAIQEARQMSSETVKHLPTWRAAADSSISTEDGLAAARAIVERLNAAGIKWALAGGMAMHLYGYVRATTDVDLLASATLSETAERQLSFGGASYTVPAGGKEISVDVIVRDDFFRAFYEAALRDAVELADGWRVVSPEWLAILKYLAGRSKDQLDLLWLLQASGLVNRDRIAELLTEVMGVTAAQVALRGLQEYYVRADVMRAGDENGT